MVVTTELDCTISSKRIDVFRSEYGSETRGDKRFETDRTFHSVLWGEHQRGCAVYQFLEGKEVDRVPTIDPGQSG